MSWIRLDPQELAATGVHLRDVSLTLEAASHRIDAACCSPGLGRHAGPLMGEGRSLASRLVGTTEDYLRQAVDILQRAVAVLQDAQLVSVVGGTGNVAAGIIGATVVGGTGPGWSTGWSGPSVMTLGGSSPTFGPTIRGPSTVSIGGGVPPYLGGGSALSNVAMIGAMIQTKQQGILSTLNAASLAGAGSGGGDLGTQVITGMLNRQALQRMGDTEIKMAASSPIASLASMERADRIDFGGRVRAEELRRER